MVAVVYIQVDITNKLTAVSSYLDHHLTPHTKKLVRKYLRTSLTVKKKNQKNSTELHELDIRQFEK